MKPLNEITGVDRLGEDRELVTVTGRIAEQFGGLFVAGKQNDARGRVERSKGDGELDPVGRLHHDIRQENVELRRLRMGEGFLGAECRQGDEAALIEDHARGGGHQFVIIDHKDTGLPGWSYGVQGLHGAMRAERGGLHH